MKMVHFQSILFLILQILSTVKMIQSNLNDTPISRGTHQLYDEPLDLKGKIVELNHQVTVLWWTLGIFMGLMCSLALFFNWKISNVRSEKQTQKPDGSEHKETTPQVETNDDNSENSYFAMQEMN